MAYQEVIELYCKNCGGSLLPISEDFCKCQNCGATYTQLTAKKQQELLDSFLNKQKQEQLNALRSHLWQEVNAKYIDSKKVVSICLDIKNIYPDDFLANFYEVVCGDYEQGVIDFIDNIDCKENYELIEQVVKFLIKSLKSEYLLSVNNLIERAYKKNDLQKYNSLTTAFAEQAKKVEEGVYELNIPRDVFVAYSSADMGVVQKVVKELEEQGLTCFVAMRNLQHGAGAVDNYQKALETAIDNCKIFLFISSKNSRNFKCDAIKHELPYLKKSDLAKLSFKFPNTPYDKINNKHKKLRIQLRLDDTKGIADGLVNEIFSGLEYCYDMQSLVTRIGEYMCFEGHDEEAEEKILLEQQNKLLQEQLKNQQEFLQKQAEEQAKRFKEQSEEQRRLKEQLNSQPTVNNVGGISVDDIIARTEERRKRAQEIARDFQIENGVLVKYIGSKKEVEIPDSVTSIGESAFEGCKSLTSVTIPDSVTSIGYFAFEGCESLTSVTIPDSVTEIGAYAFRACDSLTSVTIPDSVTSIGERAFLGCDSLISVEIPDSVTSIGYYAFANCSSLTSVTVPNSVTSIGERAFLGCDSLSNIQVDENNLNFKSIDGNLYNKEGTTLIQYAIGKTQTSFTIPDSVTSIGISAFYGCSSLTSVTIPDSVTTIGRCAFEGCSSLESITIPFVGAVAGKTSGDTYQYPFGYIFGTSSYTGSTGTEQYYYGSSTSSTAYSTYYIPSSLKSVIVTGGNILYGAFSGCKSLTSVTIPDSVTSIGNDAFSGCYKLASVTIPDSVTSIGESAFSYCTSLTSVTIPDSVTSIGDNAFYYCTSLTSVTIPDSVTSIGKDAFYNCSSLISVTIPDSVTEIGPSAFEVCFNLTINVLNAKKIKFGKDWAKGVKKVNGLGLFKKLFG